MACKIATKGPEPKKKKFFNPSSLFFTLYQREASLMNTNLDCACRPFYFSWVLEEEAVKAATLIVSLAT